MWASHGHGRKTTVTKAAGRSVTEVTGCAVNSEPPVAVRSAVASRVARIASGFTSSTFRNVAADETSTSTTRPATTTPIAWLTGLVRVRRRGRRTTYARNTPPASSTATCGRISPVTSNPPTRGGTPEPCPDAGAVCPLVSLATPSATAPIPNSIRASLPTDDGQ